MTDGFLATVDSYDSTTMKAIVTVLFTGYDGTKRPPLTVKAVAGITPAQGDVVLIITIRNNLDDADISRFFEASESNGRLVAVVSPAGGVRTFTGDYKFDGNVEFTGNVTVRKDLTIDGNASVKKDLTIDGKANITGDTVIQGGLSVTGSVTFGVITFALHKHICSAPGNPSGVPIP